MKTYYINFQGRKKTSTGRYQNIQKAIAAENLEQAKEKIKINYTIEVINSTIELENFILATI
jgi:hypothetical protein